MQRSHSTPVTSVSIGRHKTAFHRSKTVETESSSSYRLDSSQPYSEPAKQDSRIYSFQSTTTVMGAEWWKLQESIEDSFADASIDETMQVFSSQKVLKSGIMNHPRAISKSPKSKKQKFRKGIRDTISSITKRLSNKNESHSVPVSKQIYF